MSEDLFIGAAQQLRLAKAEYDRAFKAAYPVGADIRWHLGGGERWGHVTQQGHSDRLKVRNSLTGQEYWIHGHNVLEALGVT